MIRYNEIDANAAQWMRNLAAAGEIPPGEVDERPIQKITGSELAELRQFHTFAGIGGWPLALRLAGWPEDREVWTGSCPCQPFSAAGKGGGVSDPRHLWPDFFRLIAECRPGTIFGEQVAGKAGLGWLDGVFADLEGEGYTCGAVVMGAHSVGAPHIRQRIYWVADRWLAKDAPSDGRRGRRDGDTTGDDGQVQAAGLRAAGGLADNDEPGREERGAERERGSEERSRTRPTDNGDSATRGLADDDDERLQDGRQGRAEQNRGPVTPWSDYRIVPCTDGKARRTGARVFPLAHGLPRGVGSGGSWRKGLARSASRARIGMLKGSGNAIVPELAAEFVMAYREAKIRDLEARP